MHIQIFTSLFTHSSNRDSETSTHDAQSVLL